MANIKSVGPSPDRPDCGRDVGAYRGAGGLYADHPCADDQSAGGPHRSAHPSEAVHSVPVHGVLGQD